MNKNDKSKEQDSTTDPEVNSDPLLDRLEQLISIADQADLASVRVRDGEIEIEISRTTTVQQVATAPALTGPPTQTLVTDIESGTGDDVIRSPMPARFYRSPAPDEPPFIEVGDSVAAGESIATLEVMKTYNDVEAPFDCEILEIFIEDGEAVEYNQPLFRVRQN